MADLLCPHCGMPNASEQSVCSFCLKPLSGKGAEVFRPGDAPTKKSTAELEPVLPEWLRDAREKARHADAEKTAEDAQAAAERPTPKKEEPPDFLAGLASVGGDDQTDEIPDWMRSPPPVSAPSIEKEKTFPRRQEIRWEGDGVTDELGGLPTTPASAAPEQDAPLLPWMQGSDAASTENEEVSNWLSKAAPQEEARPISPFAMGSFKPPSTGELTDWLDNASSDANITPAAKDGAMDDWLANLPRGEAPAPSEESNEPFDGAMGLPAWMQREEPAAQPKEEASAPDWMTREVPFAEPKPELDLPAWVGPFGESAEPKSEPATPEWLPHTPFSESNEESEMPSWMAKSESPAPDWMTREVPFAESEAKSEAEAPSWMSAFAPSAEPAEETGEAAPTQSFELTGESDLPSWLGSLETTEPAQGSIEPPPADWPPADAKSESPDWMDIFRDGASAAETPPSPEVPRAAAFVSTSADAPQTGQADDLFASEMPDWLSNIAPAESKPAEAKEPTQENIAPAELPSWVQAMRPVETALPSEPAVTVEGPLEDRGPLAGLRGVLPLASIIQPGKPKPQSIRMQADESQQASAALLEQMLSAESEAKPLRGEGTLASQRALRWAIAAILFLIVTLSLMTGLQTAPLPSSLPAETASILPALDLLPNGAPVLMIFDYDPALAGEIESVAVPLLDRLLASRRPRVLALSTSPTGAALADKLFAHGLKRHGYQPDSEYLNLGYLPGESAGILYFAEYPNTAISPADWHLPAAQDVTRLGDFAAILLFTDQGETARAWIEQTSLQRAGRPMIVIASAQAAPMILPYAQSGQIAGLASGLRGGAVFTSSAADSPARKYWDAYQFAALFAAAMIALGGLWNFFAGLRARRQGME
ncbi:MAG: hypothetical protein HY867_01570 [Chloroflexi bacterium]|nr:hypothetical protein [Chloroflexota bacterium]